MLYTLVVWLYALDTSSSNSPIDFHSRRKFSSILPVAFDNRTRQVIEVEILMFIWGFTFWVYFRRFIQV